MTEFFTVKRIDNSRLVRQMAPQQWREFGRPALLGAALAACLLLYAAQHFQCLAVRYQLEELKAARAEAVALNQQLKLEAASLRSPMRIDIIARGRLGLTVPVPGQVAAVATPAGAILAQNGRTQTSP
jgi:cell division protein FtsL